MILEAACAEAMATLAKREGHKGRLPDWRPVERQTSALDARALTVVRRRGRCTAKRVCADLSVNHDQARESLLRLERAGHLRRTQVISSGNHQPCDAWEPVPAFPPYSPDDPDAGRPYAPPNPAPQPQDRARTGKDSGQGDRAVSETI